MSTPPRDRNQKIPTNWKTTKKNPKASWKIQGRALTTRAGSSKRAVTGETSKIAPRTTLSTARAATSFSTRATRKRFQSSRRAARRSKRPNTPWAQNRW